MSAQFHDELPVGEEVAEFVGGLRGQDGLADPAHSVDRLKTDHTARRALRLYHGRPDAFHLDFAADQLSAARQIVGDRHGELPTTGGDATRYEPVDGGLPQDGLLETAQSRTGIRAELVELHSDPPIDIQGLKGPPAPVQGEHEVLGKGLIARVLDGERFEVTNDVGEMATP
ncbi:hypothetical protein GCM10022245_32390 [Streptomyces mayteni]